METKDLTYRERKRFNKSVIHNFEVSVVIPCFNTFGTLKIIFQKSVHYLQRNGIEVVLVFAGNPATEKSGLIDLIKTHPFVNWKVIVLDQQFTCSNYASMVNTGIRYATKKYVFVACPSVEFHTDGIFQLRTLLEHYPNHYATGIVAAVENTTVILRDNEQRLKWIYSGCIMAEKKEFEKIGAYDEQINEWEDANENLYKRLDMSGVKRLKELHAKFLFREGKIPLEYVKEKQNSYGSQEIQKIFYPQVVAPNDDFWGQKDNLLIYDWQDNIYSEELCRNYLSKFLQHEIGDSNVFKRSYKKLVICQSWNEEELMSGFLEDMAKYFDGIILLDDGSTDKTWELANHEKILLKVKKKRECFNDLENRNILLDLASFFKSEWFCFVDIDERFDERFADFGAFENDPNIEVVVFKEVFLWGNEHTYKGGVPYSHKGIRKIGRMFRNIGHSHIITLKKKLHFIACPHFRNKIFYSKILLKDYGSLKKDKRLKKYQMYIQEDKAKDIPDYEYLLDDKSNLYELDKIKL